MKRYIGLILVGLTMILGYPGIIAQGSDNLVENDLMIVQLENGSVIEGKVIQWKVGEYIVLFTSWDSEMKIPSDQIKHVTPKDLYLRGHKSYTPLMSNRVYYTAALQFIMGNEGPRAKGINGLGMSVSGGYRFSRSHSLGLGVGYDRYIWKSGENFVPIFLEYMSVFKDEPMSLYSRMQLGYSLVFEDDDYSIIDAKGGQMIYPSVGLLWGNHGTKFMLDFGYKFQKATLTYRDEWRNETSEQRLLYRRLTLRFGLLL